MAAASSMHDHCMSGPSVTSGSAPPGHLRPAGRHCRGSSADLGADAQRGLDRSDRGRHRHPHDRVRAARRDPGGRGRSSDPCLCDDDSAVPRCAGSDRTGRDGELVGGAPVGHRRAPDRGRGSGRACPAHVPGQAVTERPSRSWARAVEPVVSGGDAGGSCHRRFRPGGLAVPGGLWAAGGHHRGVARGSGPAALDPRRPAQAFRKRPSRSPPPSSGRLGLHPAPPHAVGLVRGRSRVVRAGDAHRSVPAAQRGTIRGDPRTLGLFLSSIAVGGIAAGAFSGAITRLPAPALFSSRRPAPGGSPLPGSASRARSGSRWAVWRSPGPPTRSRCSLAGRSSSSRPLTATEVGSHRWSTSSASQVRSSATSGRAGGLGDLGDVLLVTGGLAATAVTLVITAFNKPLRRYTIPDQADPRLEPTRTPITQEPAPSDRPRGDKVGGVIIAEVRR